MLDMERIGEGTARGAWWIFSVAWHTVGLVIFATLAILEPIVRYVLSALATVGLLMTLVFGVIAQAPDFPTLFMFGMSVGCFVLLATYYWLMRCFGDLGR